MHTTAEQSSTDVDLMLGKTEIASRAYVSWFTFRGSDQQKLVKNLSGGERNRVHLAKLLKEGGIQTKEQGFLMRGRHKIQTLIFRRLQQSTAMRNPDFPHIM